MFHQFFIMKYLHLLHQKIFSLWRFNLGNTRSRRIQQLPSIMCNLLFCMNVVLCVVCVMSHQFFCAFLYLLMSKIDWLIGFTSENFKKAIVTNINKKLLVKQYVGLIIIVRSLRSSEFVSFPLLIDKPIIAKRLYHSWLHIDDVIIVTKSDFCPTLNFSPVAALACGTWVKKHSLVFARPQIGIGVSALSRLGRNMFRVMAAQRC